MIKHSPEKMSKRFTLPEKKKVWAIIKHHKDSGLDNDEIAKHLDKEGIKTPNGFNPTREFVSNQWCSYKKFKKRNSSYSPSKTVTEKVKDRILDYLKLKQHDSQRSIVQNVKGGSKVVHDILNILEKEDVVKTYHKDNKKWYSLSVPERVNEAVTAPNSKIEKTDNNLNNDEILISDLLKLKCSNNQKIKLISALLEK